MGLGVGAGEAHCGQLPVLPLPELRVSAYSFFYCLGLPGNGIRLWRRGDAGVYWRLQEFSKLGRSGAASSCRRVPAHGRGIVDGRGCHEPGCVRGGKGEYGSGDVCGVVCASCGVSAAL